MANVLSGFTDSQLRLFLSRVRTSHLVGYLAALPKEGRERLLGLVSPTRAALPGQLWRGPDWLP